jgi:cell division protein FtsZ
MSTGIGEGEKRLSQAIENALHSPLLNNNNPFSAKKVLFNVYYSSQNPVKIPEMDQIHEFMLKFDQQKIEVIWGIALDDSLGDAVKLTLLATGFEMSNIPGMVEKQEKARKEIDTIEQEDQRKREEMIRVVYGSAAIATRGKVRHKPIILTNDQLDDDALIEQLEQHPSYNRDPEFVQRIIQQTVVESTPFASPEQPPKADKIIF